MKVKVYSTSKHPLPQYATKQSARTGPKSKY